MTTAMAAAPPRTAVAGAARIAASIDGAGSELAGAALAEFTGCCAAGCSGLASVLVDDASVGAAEESVGALDVELEDGAGA